jgi:hypothetical protein
MYLTIQPVKSPWFEKEISHGVKKVYWEDLTNAQANTELDIERTFVSVVKLTADGKITFASAKLSGEPGKYETVLDYGKFRVETTKEEKPRSVRVGVGVRVVAKLTTTKADIDIGSIFAIGLAAKAGYLKGQIEVLKIGIDSPELSLILPPPAEINDTSLQDALQAVAAIRAKLYDQNTKIRPYVLAVETKQPQAQPR